MDSSSCHPCQWRIPYSQVPCFNGVCSNNAFFGQKCNKLEHCLHDPGYTERLVRQEILIAQKIPINELLEKERDHQGENKHLI